MIFKNRFDLFYAADKKNETQNLQVLFFFLLESLHFLLFSLWFGKIRLESKKYLKKKKVKKYDWQVRKVVL